MRLMAAGPIPNNHMGGFEGSTKPVLVSSLEYKKRPLSVKKVKPGIHQQINAKTPEMAPPCVEAVEITSWVELGPGKPWPVQLIRNYSKAREWVSKQLLYSIDAPISCFAIDVLLLRVSRHPAPFISK